MVKISGLQVKNVEVVVERTGWITYHIVGDNDHDVRWFFVKSPRRTTTVHKTLQRQHTYDDQNDFDVVDARRVNHDDDGPWKLYAHDSSDRDNEVKNEIRTRARPCVTVGPAYS